MRLRITLEGTSYEVGVEVLPESEPEMPPEEWIGRVPESVFQPRHGSDKRAEDRISRSPIAGLVISVEAKPGQWVQRDDAVVIIEAMKMQNTIHPPFEGVLEEIHVTAGETVKTGQPLFRVS